MTDRLVVIGGDAAGMSASSQARRLRSLGDLEIVVFERSSYVSYSACGEPGYVGGFIDALDELIEHTPDDFATRDIDVHVHTEVTAIDTTAHTVTVRDEQDAERTVDYDVLLYATGARARRPEIEGADLEGVHELRTLDDASAVRALVKQGVEHAVVVGGGYIGLETAEALHHEGVPTVVLSAGEAVLDPQLDADMGRLVVRRMRDTGIEVRTTTPAERIEGRRGAATSVVSGDEQFPADLVILGLGSAPEAELAAQAGIPVGTTGAVVVDDRQQTPVAGVWAAGDCAETRHRISGEPVNYHLGTIANKQGRIAGINIGGGDARFEGVLGTAITRVCETEIARTGLTESEAHRLEFDALALAFESTTAAGYWPGAEPMTMKVVVDRKTRRLLGAQIVGGAASGKRIDAVAMALWNEMTVDELVNVDLSYAPPFGGVWDPVLVAARKAQRALG